MAKRDYRTSEPLPTREPEATGAPTEPAVSAPIEPVVSFQIAPTTAAYAPLPPHGRDAWELICRDAEGRETRLLDLGARGCCLMTWGDVAFLPGVLADAVRERFA